MNTMLLEASIPVRFALTIPPLCRSLDLCNKVPGGPSIFIQILDVLDGQKAESAEPSGSCAAEANELTSGKHVADKRDQCPLSQATSLQGGNDRVVNPFPKFEQFGNEEGKRNRRCSGKLRMTM